MRPKSLVYPTSKLAAAEWITHDVAIPELAAHIRAECALRDHPALGRWLRQSPAGRLVIDAAKVRAEARLGGKYLTSDPDLTAEDVALGYQNLLEAERGFPGHQVHPGAAAGLSPPRAA